MGRLCWAIHDDVRGIHILEEQVASWIGISGVPGGVLGVEVAPNGDVEAV